MTSVLYIPPSWQCNEEGQLFLRFRPVTEPTFSPDSQSNLTANPKQDPEQLQDLHAIIHSLAQNIV